MNQGNRPGIVGTDDASFEKFVAGSSRRLFTMARLLTGGNYAEAEDLLQGAFERTYRHWPRISRQGNPDRYVRQALVNASVNRSRWRRRHPEAPLILPDASPSVEDAAALVANRDLLLHSLAQLAPSQRAVLVLRYFEDLSEAQTAAVLGCSVATVKKQARRGKARMRELAGSMAEPDRTARKGTGRND
jgi:RNA polymerase sigma-70 factor (sigma-E family)